MRAHHERNLRFGEPYFCCRFHRDTDWLLQLLVAVPPGSDLLNLAKNLFLAANGPLRYTHLLLFLEQLIARFTMHLHQPLQETIALAGIRPSVPTRRFVNFLPRA
jgi:hypothetical protein